ncbi:MAG: hypothetical protein ACK521_09690 [bacterium]
MSSQESFQRHKFNIALSLRVIMQTYTNCLATSVIIIVITGFVFLFARLFLVLAFLHCLSGASFGFLLLEQFSAQVLNLFEIERWGVFLGHPSKLTLLTFPLLVFKMLLLLELVLLELDSLDFEVLLRLRPAAGSVCLELRSGNLELDEALESWQNPVFDKLGQDNLQLASLGVNLLPE